MPAGGLVEAERAVKEPAEVAAIRAAAALADEIYAWLLERGIVGRTEREVALALEHEMRRPRRGGPELRVDRRRRRERRAAARVAARRRDPGRHARHARLRRASSTATARTARARGRPASCPTTWPRSTSPCCAPSRPRWPRCGPGPTGARSTRSRATSSTPPGTREHFGHGLGHGVGLEIHEAPRLARTGRGAGWAPGNVVTVEPGVYVPGRGGARIEDLVVVTDDGRDVLSGTSKALTIVG